MFQIVAVKKESKEIVDKLSEELGIKKYEVIQMALDKLTNKCVIEVKPEVYNELKRLKESLELKSLNDVIEILLRIPRVLYSDNLKFHEAIRPITELEEILYFKKKSER